MSTVDSSHPYIGVEIDTAGLQPRASRSFGNMAIVGPGHAEGSAVANRPVLITSEADARRAFAQLNAAGAVTASSRLYESVRTALLQDPGPSRVYGVRTGGSESDPDYASALATLEATEVQFVSLAFETQVGVAGPPATRLQALKAHVEGVSQQGNRRMGVAMVDPEPTLNDTTFVEAINSTYSALKSDSSRMVLVAARVDVESGRPVTDVAAAAAGAIAGQEPHISVLLKRIRQVKIATERQFSPSEIKLLSKQFIMPIIDPDLIPGEGLHFAAGRAYTTDVTRLYVDIVRVLDDIEFRLKAALIGSIGNVRIDRLGMQTLATRIESVLKPLQRRRVIDTFNIFIPLLPVLEKQEAARTANEAQEVTDARTNRRVDVILSVKYGPAIHFLNIKLAFGA